MIRRVYEQTVHEHLAQDRQMCFLSGPRQVGKTTTGRQVGASTHRFVQFNWDNRRHRRLLIAGPDEVAAAAGLDTPNETSPLLLFDEIHKFRKWKDFLKGFFDTWSHRTRILVTGSARLEVFNRGGDSLMGRYFQYRMHPISVAELLRPRAAPTEIDPEPAQIADSDFAALLEFGGFPEPFVRRERRFYNKWRRLRSDLLFREEVRDLTQVTDLAAMEVLASLLAERAGSLTSYSSLAGELGISIDTVKRWLKLLESLYYSFSIRPWWQNVARSLRKEPKYYLWDWSLVANPGARAENLCASALLKAVHFWTDAGLGDYALHFVRDKEKREVDFLVVRNGTPWFLVEVKSSSTRRISRALTRFHERLETSHAFQACLDMDPVNADCFSLTDPARVPMRTLLAQLV